MITSSDQISFCQLVVITPILLACYFYLFSTNRWLIRTFKVSPNQRNLGEIISTTQLAPVSVSSCPLDQARRRAVNFRRVFAGNRILQMPALVQTAPAAPAPSCPRYINPCSLAAHSPDCVLPAMQLNSLIVSKTCPRRCNISQSGET